MLTHNDLNVVVVANFDANTVITNIDFPSLGKWKNYLTGDSLQVTTTTQSFTLAPGAYKVFINDTLSTGVVTTSVTTLSKNEAIGLRIFPNPTKESCNIEFEAEKSLVKVDLYNHLGMYIKTLYTGDVEKGFNSLKINNLNYQEGIYFISLQLDHQTYWQSLLIK